jgi:hypothetical protein
MFTLNCPSCSLGKSSHLSIGLTGHKIIAPLWLVFSDVWGLLLMFSIDVYL